MQDLRLDLLEHLNTIEKIFEAIKSHDHSTWVCKTGIDV